MGCSLLIFSMHGMRQGILKLNGDILKVASSNSPREVPFYSWVSKFESYYCWLYIEVGKCGCIYSTVAYREFRVCHLLHRKSSHNNYCTLINIGTFLNRTD